MSTTDTYPETECAQCDETFTIGYNAEYCSEECLERSRAESVYNLFKHDHRFCFSCLSQLKTVSRPTDEQLRQIDGLHSKEAVVGFQYRTPNATTGEITVKADTNDIVATGTVCGNCGVTDHRDDYFRNYEPAEAAKRLRKHIKTLREEGQHSYQFSTEIFVKAWNESGGDWLLSLGRALES